MPNSKQIVYLSQAQYAELVSNGSITVDGVTVTYDANDIYVTPQAEPVTDVKISNASIVTNGTANIPVAMYPSNLSAGNFGLVSLKAGRGIAQNTNDLSIYIAYPSESSLKKGNDTFGPVTTAFQHSASFYGLAKAAGDSTQSQSSNAVGTYTDSAKSAIQSMLGVSQMFAPVESDATADRAYSIGEIFSYNGKLYQTTDAIAQDGNINPGINCQEVTIVSAFPHDVQVNNTSIVENGVAVIPFADAVNKLGVVKVHPDYGLNIYGNGLIRVWGAGLNEIKLGANQTRPIIPEHQHESAFYGLAKAAGDTTQSASNNAVGTYTDEAKGAIQSMLGISNLIAPAENTLVASKAYAVNDIFTANGKLYKVTTAIAADGTIILQNEGETVSEHNAEEISLNDGFVKKTDYATAVNAGVVKVNMGYGIRMESNGCIRINEATDAVLKQGNDPDYPVVSKNEHTAAFYGLAKAAGDATQSASSNAVGTYTDNAKAAIKSMLGVVDGSTGTVDVSGTTPTISAIENTRYICGEVSTLTVTPALSGVSIIRFTSGTTPTVLTATGVTWPEWFDADNLEADTVYEICITDGAYGAVMTWPL